MITIPPNLGTYLEGWTTSGRHNRTGEVTAGLPFALRADDITEGFAVIAQRGSGKSTTAGVMEEIFTSCGDQWIAIDPAAAHIGIRNARTKDGRPKGPSGLPVLIVGGLKGDFPLNPKGGKELAQILMETKISCVIDLKHESTANKKVFLTDFGNELLMKNQTPLHLFLDEADEIIPQQPDNREEQEIRSVWRRVIKRGRGSGLGFTILSQRAAMVDKTSLYQIQNLIVMQLSGAGDLDMIKGWFKHNTYSNEHMEQILTAMTGLKVGEAFLLSPKVFGGIFRIQIRDRVTFHAGRTPKRGEQPIEVMKYEIKDIASLFESKLQEKKQVAVDERDRLGKLTQELTTARQTIADLKTQQVRIDPEISGEVVGQAIDRALLAYKTEIVAKLVQAKKEMNGNATAVKMAADKMMEQGTALMRLAERLKLPVIDVEMNTLVAHKMTPKKIKEPQTVSRPVISVQGLEGVDGLKNSTLMALQVLCSWPDGLTERALASRIGRKPIGGGWNTLKNSLLGPGYIERNGKKLFATDTGKALMGKDLPAVPMSTSEVLQIWKPILKSSSYRGIENLIEVYPEGMTRAQLADSLGLQPIGGGWGGIMSELKGAGLVNIKGSELFANKEALLL